ncbi:MAG: 23S rRNA (guanosine(2251)-2'-O)-methyltransferase RlmB [Candidatus Reconcilbacillus cellulovorans]|uniref:23S rRNA (Guanosine(2251)-2'-O)-methyltransferase RlmB n=1 Tax=Candidatus Reconcilbacillus cellulovorans TaxID=1906605 RepID=A0A2A6E2T0_9BACL|nr:MAG: 23S rRNA (guanosine(2251)-2'-O)-methyltransferase RlmB [Candidatus Reconcilbacillus cellulovorans]
MTASEGGLEHDYIAGRRAVAEALRAGRPIHKLFVAAGARDNIRELSEEARRLGIPVQIVDRRKLDDLVPDVSHQGVVAQAASGRYWELDELLGGAASDGQPPFFVLLDGIEDPRNLGAILRTAECAGVHGVIVPKRRSAGLTAAVAKTSAGAVEHVRVARVSNVVQAIRRLRERGIWVVGADLSGDRYIYDVDLTIPVAIVVGNENAGIGRLVRESCDWLVRIPLFGSVASLNASVAAGVLLYEVVRQRRFSKNA